MKKLVLTLFFALWIHLGFGQARVKTVPEPVQKTFISVFPEAKETSWLKHQKVYTGTCNLTTCKAIASIDFEGNLLEYSQSIPVKQLPKNVIAYVDKHFPSTEVTEAWKITNAKGQVSYKIMVYGLEVLFNDKGKIQKQ